MDKTSSGTPSATASPLSPSDLPIAETDGFQTVSVDKTEHVTFTVGDQVFAFGMAKVLEIIRMPRAVAVPMTPSALLGLANLRGRVLPILEFRTLAGLDHRDIDDATRVIVVDVGQVVGLVVDRVHRVMHVESRDVETASGMESLIDGDLLDGVVKQDGGHLVQLVDPEKIVGLKFSHTDMSDVTHSSIATGDLARIEETSEDADDGGRLVSVSLDGQDYGFPIDCVDEIVRVPDTIDSVPRAADHVLGIINLRNRVLPLVCMRRVLGLSATTIADTHRVVVVRMDDRRGGTRRVGLVVDRVNEVLRINPGTVSEVPALLTTERSNSDITAILRLDDGKRLVSVLGIDRMFAGDDLPDTAEQAPDFHTQDAETETEVMTTDGIEDRQAIVFQMIDQEFGIMVEHVQEILRVPDTMNRVPKTADFVEGMMNLRGGVLPVIDMRSRLGLPRQDRADRQRVIVLDLEGRRTGFVVDGVNEVLRMPAGAVIETPRLSTVQQDMLSQAVKLDGGARLILLVDPRKLVSADDLQALDGLAA